MKVVTNYLKMNDVKYEENLSFKNLSTIRLGGTAEVVAFPKSMCEFIKLLRFLGDKNIKFKVVGNMSNLLPTSGVYNGVIIKTTRLNGIHIDSTLVLAECGITLPYLASALAHRGIGGLEELSGIPGTLGGATVGNAGAFGREISDLVHFVIAYSYDSDSIAVLTNDELRFGYRFSMLKSGKYAIMMTGLKLYRTDTHIAEKKISEYKRIRREKQPHDYPSLGSVFKRPRDTYAAKLIDELGLKGYSIGGAQISEKHAGFIVNMADATSDDVKSLVAYVVESVRSSFGIALEKEIEYLE